MLEIVLRGVFEMLHMVFILVHLKEYSVSVLLAIRPLIASAILNVMSVVLYMYQILSNYLYSCYTRVLKVFRRTYKHFLIKLVLY